MGKKENRTALTPEQITANHKNRKKNYADSETGFYQNNEKMT